MQFESTTLSVETEETDTVNLTDQIETFIEETGMTDGLCLVYSTHTTAGIVVNEDEPGLRQDMIDHLDQVFPANSTYQHNQRGPDHDKNGDSHLKTIFTGSDHTLPIEDGRLVLGTYQQVFLVETDGPRSREVGVYLLGE